MNFRLLFLIITLPAVLSAQITITNDDMPQEGDTIRKSHSMSSGDIDFTSTGADHDWDFADITPLYQTIDSFVSIQETPLLYQLVFMWTANMAKALPTFDQLPDFQVTDTYEFFDNSESNYKSVGIGVTLSGIPIPNSYEDPDIIYTFPLAYENQDSSLSSHEISIPGIGYMGGWKKRNNYVDGWGTLTTPYGSFEVLRVKSDIIQYDSIYIDSIGIGFPILRDFTEYKWLGSDFGIPLLTVKDEGVLPTIEYIDSVRSLNVVNLNDVFTNNNDIHIFPNPVVDDLNIFLNRQIISDVKVVMFDLTGRKVLDMLFPSPNVDKISLNLCDKNLHKGFYLMMIQVDNEVITQNIIVE